MRQLNLLVNCFENINYTPYLHTCPFYMLAEKADSILKVTIVCAG